MRCSLDPKRLDDVAQEFLVYQREHTEDPESTVSNLRIISRHLGRRLLTEIGPREVEAMIAARLQDGIAKSTINRQSATLSKLFSWSIERGYHPGPNPMEQVKRFQETRGQIRYLTPDEAGQLILAAANHLKPIIVAALHTGGRLNEVLSLEWQDVDFAGGLVTFRRSTLKGRRDRQVPLTAELAATLRALQPHGPQEWRPRMRVFEYKRRGLVTVREAFTTARRKAGLGRDVVFPTLRHTYAAWFVLNGGDLFHLQQYLGHANIALIDRYSHLSPHTSRSGVEFIGPPRKARSVNETRRRSVKPLGPGPNFSPTETEN
jgi:integrase